MKVSRNTFLLLLTLGFSVLAVVLYWPARNGTWVLDDRSNIVGNIRLRDFSDSFRLLLEGRGLSFLSFVLNLKWWGLDPAAFRWVNVVIHTMNSLLVVLLLRQLTGSAWRWAIVGGLFFLCHPVQTSAVSYIVQRMTLLSSFFALSAILLVDRYFVLIGEGRGTEARKFLFMSVCCGIFSVMSKENTVLLPLVIPLLAWLRGGGRLAAGWRLAFSLWLSISAVAIIYQYFTGGSTVEQLSGVPFYKDTGMALFERLGDQDRAFLSIRYFLSQLEVFWVYLGLIFFPLHQALDYNWPIPDLRLSLLHLGTLALIATSLWCAWNRRDRYPYLFFGTAWILIFIIVESSIIPLDPIFEHRLYLPLVGLIFIFRDTGALFPKRAGLLIAVVAIFFLAFLSWQRNLLWGDPISFWQNDVRVAARAPRPVGALAVALFAEKRFAEAAEEVKRLSSVHNIGNLIVGEALYFSGQTEEAMAAFLKAVKRNEPGANGIELFNAYKAIQEKRFAEAKELLEQAERRNINVNVTILYFRGMLAEAQNDPIGAVKYYHKVIKAADEAIRPAATLTFGEGYALWARERRTLLLAQLSGWLDSERRKTLSAASDINIRGNFANQLMELGLYEEARTHFEDLMKGDLKPWSLYYNLGITYEKLGRFSDAEKVYEISHELHPDNQDVSFNYISILAMRGKLAKAHDLLSAILRRSPDDGRFLLLAGEVLEKRGEINAARDAYERASQLPAHQVMALSKLENLNKQAMGKNE